MTEHLELVICIWLGWNPISCENNDKNPIEPLQHKPFMASSQLSQKEVPRSQHIPERSFSKYLTSVFNNYLLIHGLLKGPRLKKRVATERNDQVLWIQSLWELNFKEEFELLQCKGIYKRTGHVVMTLVPFTTRRCIFAVSLSWMYNSCWGKIKLCFSEQPG